MFSKYLFITTLLLRLAIHLTLATNVFNVFLTIFFRSHRKQEQTMNIDIKPLSGNPTKWSNTLKQIVG